MVNVNNEWGKLKEVIVGTVDNANMPTHGKDLHCINYATDDSIPKNELGFWDQKVYDETYEDLENLSNCSIASLAPIPSVCSLSVPSDANQLKVPPYCLGTKVFILYSSILSLP